MKVFLSYTLNEKTPAYGGGEGFISKPDSSIKKGNSANTSIWKFSNHLGTHIDLPHHFFDEGQALEDFNAENWSFEKEKIQMLFIDMPENELLIKPSYVKNKQINPDAELVLLKTGFG